MSSDKVKNIKLVLKDNDISEYFGMIIGSDVDSHKPQQMDFDENGKKRKPKSNIVYSLVIQSMIC